MSDLELLLAGWSLTTAEISYHLPDHRSLLQTYIWQEYDLYPRLPRLSNFIRFWQLNLDGPIHSVRVACPGIIKPTDMKHVGSEFRLN